MSEPLQESATGLRSGAMLGHDAASWTKILSAKVSADGCLSHADAMTAVEEIISAAMKQARRTALLDASTEVAGHWNDRSTTCNQYEQVQRSAGVLQRKALEVA